MERKKAVKRAVQLDNNYLHPNRKSEVPYTLEVPCAFFDIMLSSPMTQGAGNFWSLPMVMLCMLLGIAFVYLLIR